MEVRNGAVMHTDVANMNEPPIGEEKYFVTFIDKAPCHVKAFLLKLRC